MTDTHRTLIKVLGLANVVVFALAAFLLWYIWPVLVETQEPVASANEVAIPSAAPTELLSEQAQIEPSEQMVQEPMLAVTAEGHIIVDVPPPLDKPEPTATPYTLIWPQKDSGGQGASAGLNAPAAAPTVALAPQQVNIVLMGCDYRQGQAHWRTDTIVVLSVNPQDMTISMLSVPRDLWVYIPGFGSERINTADFLGERLGTNNNRAGLLKKVIQMNLGIPIHYFVRVNYDAFEKIINTLGGVTVEVNCPLEEIFENKKSPTGWSRFSIKPGIHHMDGWTALLYARVRKATNDFSRARRQHEIMKGVWQGALAADIIRDGPRLWSILHDSVQTDLGLPDMLALGYVAIRVRPEDIRSYFIDYGSVQSWTTPAGAAVLLPEPSKIREIVQTMFSPPKPRAVPTSAPAAISTVSASAARVTVLDGAGNPDWSNLAASQLRWKGLKVVRVAASGRKDYAQTVVVDYGTSTNSENLTRLCSAIGVKPERVQKAPDPASPVDFQVTIGRDYDPCQAN